MKTDTDTSSPDRNLALVGYPLGHTRAHYLQRRAFEVLGLPFSYDLVEIEAGGLGAFISELDSSWLGLSVTMPLKRELVPLLDSTSPIVDLLGVANTVVFREEEGKRTLHGANTDVEGIYRAIAGGSSVRSNHALLLGGGGTAASAMVAAQKLGVSSFEIRVRNPQGAAGLARLAGLIGADVTVKALDELLEVTRAPMVISALPVGTTEAIELLPDAAGGVLFDVTYASWPNSLAARWRAAGGTAISGYEMLVEQAIGQLRLFVGNEPDEPLQQEDETRHAMRQAGGFYATDIE